MSLTLLLGIAYNKNINLNKTKQKLKDLKNKNEMLYYKYILDQENVLFISNQVKVLIKQIIRNIINKQIQENKQDNIRQLQNEVQRIDSEIIQLTNNKYENRPELYSHEGKKAKKHHIQNIYKKIINIMQIKLKEEYIDYSFFYEEIKKIEYIIFLINFEPLVKKAIEERDQKKDIKIKQEMSYYIEKKKLYKNELIESKRKHFVEKMNRPTKKSS